MVTYIIVGAVSGILFGVMDGLINANPLAQRLYAFLKPLAKQSVNVLAGVVIDLVYGFAMAAIFLLLYASLPGAAGWLKGISFALLVWFFRVLMSVLSQWMMTNAPAKALLYTLVAGMGEMLVLGILYGLTLSP